MLNTNSLPKTYTPEEVAQILQLSKNTVYDLIGKGEIIAKKIGKVYRVPQSSLSFVFTGIDEDLYKAEQIDTQTLSEVRKMLRDVRSSHS